MYEIPLEQYFYPFIPYIYELQGNRNLSFLDLVIINSNRKPTNTGGYIKQDSAATFSYKLPASCSDQLIIECTSYLW